MNCQQYRQQLDECDSASINPALRDEIQAHLAQCPECRKLQQLDQQWQQALRESTPAIPAKDDDFTNAVLDRAQAMSHLDRTTEEGIPDAPREPVVFSFHRHWLPLSLAALLALGLLSGLWYNLSQNQAPGNFRNASAASPVPGEVFGQLVRNMQTQWSVQPQALLDGMQDVIIAPDWRTWLGDVPGVIPDPADFFTPEMQHESPKNL